MVLNNQKTTHARLVEAQLNRREMIWLWLVYAGVWLLGLLGLFAYS